MIDIVFFDRFPIPDLRSVHDMDRVPWWQQNLHPEVLILETKDITLKTAVDGDANQSKYEFQCRDLHGNIFIFVCKLFYLSFFNHFVL